MKTPNKPINENERSEALAEFDIIDSLPEEEYDNITKLASYICNTPISLVTFIDKERQFFKSAIGMSAAGTTRDEAFCAHAINYPSEIMIVQDARLDNRFHGLSKQYAPNTARVLDLGTGSGAIAISLAEQRPALDIVATDISAKALVVAKKNAQRLGVHVSFVESDWFSALNNERFDLIVSNPPYVAHGDPHLTEGDLRFEPITALTDNEPNQHGLACIRRIIEDSPKHLNGEGWLLFEHGYDQADACRELLAARGFVELSCTHDLAGIPRVSGGRWPAADRI